ncbi:unnamed protein product [Cylindrotheca closterium]|uniref:Molybdate-anion transporter n=1 Tax=Cylindrotheca closterium TaxID=2856 RepID=A0AAD2CDS2_9STRA|nr:unnamed protein product [Cylindrotheca closterium]
MANFSGIFFAAVGVCAVITFLSSDFYKQKFKKAQETNAEDEISPEMKERHTKLLKKYLFVYLLAVLSDWLQGPYVYALYMEYGFEQHEIAELFVAGFGSSMVFGSFVGGMADSGGRKTFVIIFAAVYAASCVTKHFKDYSILMLGRLLGGVATSLLFSVFEAWLIRAHADAELPKSCLSKSFSWAAFSNSITAIFAGLVANKLANESTMTLVSGNVYVGGFLNPFDLALAACGMCAAGAFMLWDENYGERGSNGKDGRENKGQWYKALQEAFGTTINNRDVLLCGLISSLFEGSMYIFVFCWTPLLKSFAGDADLPFGLIFSTFMVSCMAGSSLFSILVEQYPIERLAVVLFAFASVGMAIVGFGVNESVSFIGMLFFEMCVGMYFPIMGTMKGGIVPENKRAAIYNLYRIPLNFIVLFSLLNDLTASFSFKLNATMLAVATGLQFILTKRRLGTGNQASSPNKEDSKPLLEEETEDGGKHMV